MIVWGRRENVDLHCLLIFVVRMNDEVFFCIFRIINLYILVFKFIYNKSNFKHYPIASISFYLFDFVFIVNICRFLLKVSH